VNLLATYKYCGRLFSLAEVETIRQFIADEPNRSRAHLSRLVCQTLGWYKPDGGLKDMSCRVALLRMHKDGLITLPPPRHCQATRRPRIPFTARTNPQEPITTPVNGLPDIQLQAVAHPEQQVLWREYIHRYHYLGYTPLPGAQLRYIATSGEHILALLGFGAAAWKIAPRDHFIGWSPEQRQQRLHLVVNNARFLILPWVASKNLASKLLGLVARRLPDEWRQRYGYRPVLLETFVETQRFQGTCYKAANWLYVGQTKGRGKLDVRNISPLPPKDIWLYPLSCQFKQVLCKP
jgi:hypothetical protein